MKPKTPPKGLGTPKKNLARMKTILARGEKAQNFGKGMANVAAGLAIGTVLFSHPSKLSQRVFLPVLLSAVSLPFGLGGIKAKGAILSKCIGRARVAREMTKAVKNPATKKTLFVLGNGKFNLTEKESLQAVLNGKGTTLEKNYADRALKREIERLNTERKLPN